MSYSKAKMHQIQIRLGLRPRPRCGSLQRSPYLDLRGPTFKGGEGKGREERAVEVRERQRRGGEGMDDLSQILIWLRACTALISILHTVTDLLETNPDVIVIALDFSKAFDSVRHATLMEKYIYTRHWICQITFYN